MRMLMVDRTGEREDVLVIDQAEKNSRYEVRISVGGQVYCYNCGSDELGGMRVGFPKTDGGLSVQILPVLPGMEGPPGKEVERRGDPVALGG